MIDRLLETSFRHRLIVVAVAHGTSFVVTTVFLTRYATAMDFRGITLFFLPYSVTAFAWSHTP